MALSRQQRPGADRRHHSQQMPAAESQTRQRAWYLAEEARPWEQRGRKPWQTKDGLRPVSMITTLVEKRGYTYLGPWTFQRPWKRDVPCCCCCYGGGGGGGIGGLARLCLPWA
jgi:hypothetical protein